MTFLLILFVNNNDNTITTAINNNHNSINSNNASFRHRIELIYLLMQEAQLAESKRMAAMLAEAKRKAEEAERCLKYK